MFSVYFHTESSIQLRKPPGIDINFFPIYFMFQFYDSMEKITRAFSMKNELYFIESSNDTALNS